MNTTRRTIRRVAIAATTSAIALSTFSVGAADAGRGPVCEDNEAPVCEDPPPPPERIRLTIVSPDAPGF